MLRLVSKRILGAASREVPAPALQVLPRSYNERVFDHYNNPRNVGSFDKNDPTVVTTLGRGSAIASSSVATEWVKGKQMEEVLSIKNTQIVRHLSSHPFKFHRLMFAEDAFKAGVKSYEAKRALATATEATSGETAATPVMAPVKNRLRPISPHLSIYKPQSSSMASIFNRISGATLAAMVLGFYLLCMKMPLICFTFAEFYQFFHFSANFSVIYAQIAAVAMSYHLYDGIKRLLH